MKTEKLNLEPIQEFMYNHTYQKGFHIEELSYFVRKVITELALAAFAQKRNDDVVNPEIEDYICKLDSLADALDKVKELNQQ